MHIDLNKEANRIKKATLFKGCVHHDDNCKGRIILSHSIQENGVLDSISKDGQVIGIDFSNPALYIKPKLSLVGKGVASTFKGFCEYHDNNIFLPIENKDYIMDNQEQNFLFAYRAFALSYYERHSAYEFKKQDCEHRKGRGEDVTSFEKEISHYKQHLEYIESLRIAMNLNLDNNNFYKLKTETLIWPSNYKIAATSMFFIAKDKEGNTINRDSNLSPFFLTVLPKNQCTYVLISYLAKDKTRYNFIRKQIVDVDIEEQKMLISNIIATSIENFYINPDKWEIIPSETKQMFLKIFEFTIINGPVKIGYFNNFNIFLD